MIINQYITVYSSKVLMPVIQYKPNKWLTEMSIWCCWLFTKKSTVNRSDKQVRVSLEDRMVPYPWIVTSGISLLIMGL